MDATTAKCPVCAQSTAAATVQCPRCAVAYHRDCWAYQEARCTIFGCVPAVAAAPATPPPAQRPWAGIAYVVVALLLGVARGAARNPSYRPPPPPPIR